MVLVNAVSQTSFSSSSTFTWTQASGLHSTWRCLIPQLLHLMYLWLDISVIFLLQAWQAINTLSLFTNLKFLTLISFSEVSSNRGPCNDCSFLSASLKVVVGVVVRWVLPWKFFTLRFWNSYVDPFFSLSIRPSQMWMFAVPVSSSKMPSSFTIVIFWVDFTGTDFGLSLPKLWMLLHLLFG